MNNVLPMAFHNAAGWIQNILEEPCGGVAVIFSKAGAERSHHYHRTDWHWLYVLEGEMQYYERRVGDTKPAVGRVIRQGERIFTGPLIEHVCRFPVDTTVISMSRLSRTHDQHEADVVRVHVDTE
jgi:hypothetical protein